MSIHVRQFQNTDKFPTMYQIALKGYIISTTSKDNFDKLVKYLTTYCGDGSYRDIPASKQTMIESNYTVKQVMNMTWGGTPWEEVSPI